MYILKVMSVSEYTVLSRACMQPRSQDPLKVYHSYKLQALFISLFTDHNLLVAV